MADHLLSRAVGAGTLTALVGLSVSCTSAPTDDDRTDFYEQISFDGHELDLFVPAGWQITRNVAASKRSDSAQTFFMGHLDLAPGLSDDELREVLHETYLAGRAVVVTIYWPDPCREGEPVALEEGAAEFRQTFTPRPEGVGDRGVMIHLASERGDSWRHSYGYESQLPIGDGRCRDLIVGAFLDRSDPARMTDLVEAIVDGSTFD